MVLLTGFYSNGPVNAIKLVMVITIMCFPFGMVPPNKLILTQNLILASLRQVMHL